MVTVTVLGCGASAGVPSVGNHWGNCDPAEPKNRRRRPSIAVRSETTTLVVDTGPDFREQMNAIDIKWIDGVLYTHAHGDHVAGMDDLRPLRMRKKKLIDIYAMPETMAELRRRFTYIFDQEDEIYPEIVIPHEILPADYGQPTTIGDITLIPFDQDHGTRRSLGFRFGNFAYSTDMIRLGAESLQTLRGIDIWIVDGAGYRMERNFVHATIADVIRLNETVGARQVYLTHMTPLMDYATLRSELPDGYAPAYDGLKFDIIM